MTHKQAIAMVLRAAEAHASGHGHCLDILRAVEMVRELLNVAKRKKDTGAVAKNRIAWW